MQLIFFLEMAQYRMCKMCKKLKEKTFFQSFFFLSVLTFLINDSTNSKIY